MDKYTTLFIIIIFLNRAAINDHYCTITIESPIILDNETFKLVRKCKS